MVEAYCNHMKNYIFIILVALTVSACNNNTKVDNLAGDSTTMNSEEAPVIKFENDIFEFGKIKQGESVSNSFKFVNTGKSPLIIKDAAVTCGCTVPEYSKTPIAPGESGVIKVVFNSAGKEGLQDKVVTLTANTIPAETQIHLIGEVIK